MFDFERVPGYGIDIVCISVEKLYHSTLLREAHLLMRSSNQRVHERCTQPQQHLHQQHTHSQQGCQFRTKVHSGLSWKHIYVCLPDH